MELGGGRIVKNIVFSALAKAINVGCLFVAMPMSLRLVSEAQYGVWLTIYSVLSWFSIFDFGLANGLKNKFTQAVINNEQDLARRYVSTTYFLLVLISLALILILYSSLLMVDPYQVLGIQQGEVENVRSLLFVVIFIQLVRFILEPIMTILTSSQKIGVVNWLNALGNVLSVIILFIMGERGHVSLVGLGVIATAPSVLVVLMASLVLYSGQFRPFRPARKYIDRHLFNSILHLGGGFFIVQIAGLIIFSTDNLIVLRLFSASEVVPYNISYRYFSVIYIGFGIILAPFWPAFTARYAKGDIAWIRGSVRKLIALWLCACLFGALMLAFSSSAYQIWFGSAVEVSMTLSFSMFLFTAIANWNNIFANFLNGVSKIRIQIICSVIIALLNIPLCILFARTFNLGISGIMFATCTCLFLCSILQPIQYYFIVNRKAQGLWNR